MFRDITEDVRRHRLADAKAAIIEAMTAHGDVGYVRDIGIFLQQFYIYAVEWVLEVRLPLLLMLAAPAALIGVNLLSMARIRFSANVSGIELFVALMADVALAPDSAAPPSKSSPSAGPASEIVVQKPSGYITAGEGAKASATPAPCALARSASSVRG